MRRAAVFAAAFGAAASACAGMTGLCEDPQRLDAEAQDRVLRFAAVVKDELERSGQRLALIARSGLDLRRHGVRYTHAGVSLRQGARSAWNVRQLYYACDEARPRIFDQGLAGFLFGLDDPDAGFISLVLLPPAAEAAFERAARDDRTAVRLLGTQYSPNAYPYSVRYQNCNQWLAEMLAAAWDTRAADASEDRDAPRRAAQDWLKEHGYRPASFEFRFPHPRWLTSLVPLLQHDDHPAEELDAMRLQVSLPASVEGFVRALHPQAERIELCRRGERIVIRHGWRPLTDACRPEAGDQVVLLD